MVNQAEDEVPTVKRRPLPRGRARKRPRAFAVEDRESGVLPPTSGSALYVITFYFPESTDTPSLTDRLLVLQIWLLRRHSSP